MLSSATWDRLVYHRLLSLAESVAEIFHLRVEALLEGRGFRYELARGALLQAMVRRGGCPLAAARELLHHAAPGGVPVAARRPCRIQLPTTPAQIRKSRTCEARSTAAGAAGAQESAFECSRFAA